MSKNSTDEFFDPERHNAMMDEWRAWRTMCRVLKHYGIDVDESSKEIVQAISNWGYRQTLLHDLIPGHDGKPPFYDVDTEEALELEYPEDNEQDIRG